MNIDIEEQYDKIYRYCYFRLHNKELAEDITQETLLRFLDCSNYKDMGKPLAYLYTIARNLCIDTLRKQQNTELLPDIEAVTSQDDFEERIVNKIALNQAMKYLTKQEQELLLLRYVNEVPLVTLSTMYGKSRFALYRELTKITQKLERRISNGT